MSPESKTTASRCTTEAETGSHTFEIVGYSLKKGIGIGRFVRSTTFTVGGYDWAIRFYPDGTTEATKQHVATFLELMTANAEVRARYSLRFAGQPPVQVMGAAVRLRMAMPTQMATRSQMVESMAEGPRLFKSCDATRFGTNNVVCILRSTLEHAMIGYICDDRLTIECDLTVIRESHLSGDRVESEIIKVPPCDIMEQFGKLLEQKVGADVTFIVGGETFEAHKIVLAARSPVFMAQFYGQMRESETSCVTVEDVQPVVFGALLHFIYNDSLPDMGDLEGNEYGEMIRHLLVTADRYAMERMKLLCQSILTKNLDVETVATTLALADQHNCDKLKAACIQFVASSKNMDAVVATQGYANLKRTCPSVFVDLFEKTSKVRKT
uniref:BTB domain-containing protein n=1 Tax=Arundo donax TaxID=35708 RepID=A0A0A9HAP9_ARUDO